MLQLLELIRLGEFEGDRQCGNGVDVRAALFAGEDRAIEFAGDRFVEREQHRAGAQLDRVEPLEKVQKGLALRLLAVVAAARAEAFPAFARKYGMSCSACHVAWPIFNQEGQNFRDNGYQFNLGKDDPVQKSPDYFPLAVRITPAYQWTRTTNQTATDAVATDTTPALTHPVTTQTGGVPLPPGIDVLLMGTNDLCLEMGIPGQLDNERVVAAIDTVIAACKKHGKWPGMGGAYSEELLQLYIGKGMKLLLAGNDLPMLTNAARTHQAKVRAFQKTRAKPKAAAKKK